MSLKALRLVQRRLYSTPPRYSLSHAESQALDDWIASPKQLRLTDSFSVERVSDLYITLPTRDGTRSPYKAPEKGELLGYGSHLAFFHPRNPESVLRPDGTDADFCPPPPLVRRMWAGGRMTWNPQNPLRIGQKAGSPMAFVKQKIEVVPEGQTTPSVVEERSHVYIAESVAVSKVPREVKGIPPTTDFSFTFTPSLTTLFRFSALTWNGHHIHLDKEYAQLKEGYPERLVHGPLTALMLLETTMLQKPGAQFSSFEYRARNPIIVNRPMTIAGFWKDDHNVSLWVVNDEGVVGMTGEIQLASD
ncbi:Mesaconyl-C(4)-CoA hydratase [Mycena sanguinolenta]|uniref:Mesaconyl-C(4)-CoA hydratase n=1 Tax=Mycena sanguinolenta TaxID=230812 RepID=A0A8H6Z2F6_9AGAR|nr:Mesaconyl-C(4)-CoA hydratase [Mycena sanguinolenta]